ncbi:MAG TPA: TetR/AcrR family transcriptional regulator [Rhodocyclaceae bacterium]|nr:TetR/AcrR family transcriptional regulator [Rhodocyclaceae bacterium]
MTARDNPDRRVLRTRVALRDALLALLPEKGWDDLNVQEICDRANVGRSTFYLHYQSKEDLLSEGLNDLRAMLGATGAEGDSGPARFAFLPGLLAHMIENRAVFRTVIGRRSGHVVERRFRAMVVQLLEDDLAGQGPGAGSPEVHARFIAGGWVDLMAWWVDTANPPPIEVLELQLRELAVRVGSGRGESE